MVFCSCRIISGNIHVRVEIISPFKPNRVFADKSSRLRILIAYVKEVKADPFIPFLPCEYIGLLIFSTAAWHFQMHHNLLLYKESKYM